MLTVERLKEVLNYNPDTGVFTWKSKMSRKIRIGAVAGSIHRTYGYRYIRIDGPKYRAHRLAWLYMTGEWPPSDIDHRNRIRDDNRWINLRLATQSENNQNMGVSKRNQLGIQGVSPARYKWRAQLTVGGVLAHRSYHNTVEEATEAYLSAKKELHPFWDQVSP